MLGLALLVLSLPGFLGAASALPAGPALNSIRAGRAVAEDELARAVAALQQSLRWGGTSAATLSDLALLELVQLQAGEIIGDEEVQRLVRSLTAQEAGLARAPAHSNGWARLTYARYALAGLDEASRDALEMSLLTGRRERAPMAFRLQLILQEWEALDAEMRVAGRAEIRQLARYGRAGLDALVDAYRSSGGSEIIHEVLAEAPEDLVRFERRLKREWGTTGRRPGPG